MLEFAPQVVEQGDRHDQWHHPLFVAADKVHGLPAFQRCSDHA
ncbi:MAG: hypothetical protein WC913_01620 [Desulfuromonas sp.]